MKFVTHSADRTMAVAAALADRMPDGGVIAMTGDLGAGKTAFTKGLAAALGYTGEVSSPTFAIVHEYVGGRIPLYHFDMYRVSGWDDLYSTGFFDYAEQRALLAVEWSENISSALPERHVRVDIRRGDGDNDRVITITPVGGFSLEDFSDRVL
jgi:tRNA threonylcarbamoyladenosine biosynthesis protein TsaE